ncbi:MAG: hypothetical protein K0R73_816 [Candidatus Midichloriaceae bacterium]|jgi:hypothetical protein|nr:hypothetical protein [Candidatus Midichloriaceae bacterium]
MTKQLRIKVAIVFISMGLTSCSHVSSEWDCPRQEGIGCIDIKKADSIAISNIREVWFAPHVDKAGNMHEASTVRYKE